VNPVLISTWQEALRPVAPKLLEPIFEPLSRIISDRSTTDVSRFMATGLLADYGKDDPTFLCRCIVQAEPKSFAALFPVLTKHRDQAVQELEAILEKKLEPDWADQALDPSWVEIPPAIKAVFDKSHGVITERYAICQDMPLEQFVDVATTMRASGYRPTRIRPWEKRSNEQVTKTTHSLPATHFGERRSRDEGRAVSRANFLVGFPISSASANPIVHVAAIWTRDNKRWLIESNLEKSQLPDPETDAIKDGLVLHDVAAINNEQKLIALWSEPNEPEEKRRCAIDIDENTLQNLNNQLILAGFKNYRISVRTDTTGKRFYCALWRNIGSGSEMYWRHEGYDLPYRPQVDVGLSPSEKLANPAEVCRSNIDAYRLLPDAKKSETNQRFNYIDNLYWFGETETALSESESLIASGVSSNFFKVLLQFQTLSLARLQRRNDALKSLEKVAEVVRDESSIQYIAIQVSAWLGDFDDADQKLKSGMKTSQDSDGKYLLARAAACCSAACIGKDETRKKLFADQAFELLERAIELGYSDGLDMSQRCDFADLHSHPRFKKLLGQILVPKPFTGIWSSDTTIETKHCVNEGEFADIKQIDPSYRPCGIAVGYSDFPDASVRTTLLLLRPIIPEEFKESLAEQQSKAAIALLKLNANDHVWPLLRHQPEPRFRSYLLNELTQYGIDPVSTIQRLDNETESSSRRILILSIGKFAEAKLLSHVQITETTRDLLRRFGEDVDPGVHAACEWSLKKLGAADEMMEIRAAHSTGDFIGERQWYVTKYGNQTMMLVEMKGEFLIGSPIGEYGRADGPTGLYESQHRRQVNRRLAIMSHEVTVSQFREFRPLQTMNTNYYNTFDSPANSISWFDAAAYCNWLSEREGIPRDQWCYNPDEDIADGMTLVPDYLSRTGYRLPTETEWEFACRAGSITSRYYGDSDSLLGEYAWYSINSQNKRTLPVGSLLPNDLGFFDMHGNMIEWTQNSNNFNSYRLKTQIDQEEKGKIGNSNYRGARGGSFLNQAWNVRSSVHYANGPNIPSPNHGFRPSRTIR